MRTKLAVVFTLLLACTLAQADPEDPATLKDEALQILKANATKEATPEEYASCIFKLERAQALLEAAGDNDSALAQEVGTSLFWARRFSNVKVLSALDALKGKQPAPPPAAKKPPAKMVTAPPKKVEGETPEMAKARESDAAFSAAQGYAASHSGDDYAVALAWFRMASEHPGTDAALKALDLAREAQTRFAGKKGVATEEVLPDSPEMALVKQADDKVKQKDYEAAFPLFDQALKEKDSQIAHRHKANAHYLRAQQLREELKPRFAANREAYKNAYAASWVINRGGQKFYNPDSPAMAAWNRDLKTLQKEGDVANKNFEAAEHEFAKALKLAPEGKDFESAGYMGLCIGVRPFFRDKGVRTLDSFIKDYTPANDVQRSLYEFCKTEIERLKKGG